VLALTMGASRGLAQPADAPPSSDDRAREPADAPPPPEGEALPPAGGRPGLREFLPRQMLELPPKERRAKFREFLEARRTRVDRIQKALDEALKSLDGGKSIEEVVTEFPAELRSDLRPGGGRGAGPGGGPGGPGGLGGPMNEGPPGAPGQGPGPVDERDGSIKNLNDLGPVVPAGDGPPSPGAGQGRGPGGQGQGRGPGPRPGAREGRAEITDADRAVFDEFLGSAAPRVQVMMRELRKQDPERADHKIVEAMPRMRWLIDLREKDRPLYDLRLRDIRAGREAFDAARAIARFDHEHADQKLSPEREKLAGDLRKSLQEQYDVRGQILAHDIAKIESDLAKQREELANRADGKSPVIEKTFDLLIERAKEWGRGPRDRDRRPGKPAGPEGEGQQPPPP
jgi:hypothetical protein